MNFGEDAKFEKFMHLKNWKIKVENKIKQKMKTKKTKTE